MEVPKLAFYFDWKITSDFDEFVTIYCETQDGWVKNFRTEFTNPNQFEILGKLSELTDKDCEGFVDKYMKLICPRKGDNYNEIKFACYAYSSTHNQRTMALKSAKESFISLLQSEGVDTNKEYLIIKVSP